MMNHTATQLAVTELLKAVRVLVGHLASGEGTKQHDLAALAMDACSQCEFWLGRAGGGV